MMRRWLERRLHGIIKPTCPVCGADIALADLSVKRATMCCAACGETSPVTADADSETDPIAAAMAAWTPDSDPVVAPKSPKTQLSRPGDDLVLTRRTGSRAAMLFLLVWLTGWTVGCFFMVKQAIQEPSLEMILFAIPFVAAWLAVSVIVIGLRFGREQLTVGRRGLTYRREAIVPLRTVTASLDDVRDITRFVSHSDSESNEHHYGLRIRTAAGDIRFGKGLGHEGLLWLADTLRRHLHKLAPRVADRLSGIADGDEQPDGRDRMQRSPVEILKRGEMARPQPGETGYALVRDFNQTELFRKPSWRGFVRSVAVMTFLNLFWNGIVGMFIYQLFVDFEWLLFFFLIPFEVVGLMIIFGWLAALLAPLTRHCWTFAPAEARYQRSIFGIGRTRRYALTELDRIELRKDQKSKRSAVQYAGVDEEADKRCSLALVGIDGQDVLEIDSLTENEARWIADVLFDDFRQWFIRIRQS